MTEKEAERQIDQLIGNVPMTTAKPRMVVNDRS